MRGASVLVLLVACSSPKSMEQPDVDAPAATPDAPSVDAPPAVAGFGTLSGMCGVLSAMDLTSATPELIHDTFTFDRKFVDPDDRPLLTEGGQHMISIPNAGGSSILSEVFAFEQLARCETATLLKTETEIVYSTAGKMTDLEVFLDGRKIGVSVTRAMTYPYGGTYALDSATQLISRKLSDIKMSTANVSAEDKWDKQILAVLAWDATAAATVEQAWQALDASTKADTIVVVTATDGDDLFIYSNM